MVRESLCREVTYETCVIGKGLKEECFRPREQLAPLLGWE